MIQQFSGIARTAKLAGLLYLIVVVCGTFSIAYVPDQLIVPGDISTTVHNISSSMELFRLGIALNLVTYIAFLMLPIVFYKLLSPVDREIAVFMVCFAVVSVPFSLAGLKHYLDILTLLGDSPFLRGLGVDQVHTQVMLSLQGHRNGILIAQTFWGLWLFPLGYLVFKSGFLPKILGLLLILGCMGYLIHVYGTVLFAGYGGTGLAGYVRLPAALGEMGICVWLLILGFRGPKAPLNSVYILRYNSIFAGTSNSR